MNATQSIAHHPTAHHPTAHHPVADRVRTLAEEILGPVRAAQGTARRRMLVVRSVVAYVGLVATLAQIAVWMTITALTAHVDSPWWLFTAVPAAAAVGVITAADRWHTWFASTSKEQS